MPASFTAPIVNHVRALGEARGINIEHPILFTSGGRWYNFVAMISNPDVSLAPQAFDNKHIELFEYTNEINSLCLYGNLIYIDVDGMVAKYFNRTDNHVEVYVEQMKKMTDGGADGNSLDQFVPFGRPNGEDYFVHSFIVQNIGILKRDGPAIVYQISLISSIWYSLCANVVYSNYGDVDMEGKKTKKNGFAMIQKFLADAVEVYGGDVSVDSETFEKAAKSNVGVPFMTDSNETVFSAVGYLLDRSYWTKGQIEQTVKYIVFDPVGNKYRCVDWSDTSTWSSCTKTQIILSMFETTFEESIFSSNHELAAVVGKTQTKTYESLFDHKISKFNPETGDFDDEEDGFDQKFLASIHNSRPDSFEEMVGNRVIAKYPVEINKNWFRGSEYVRQGSIWNRDFSIYDSLIGNLVKRDALIVNMDGDVTHQPGCALGIVLDETMEKVPEMTARQLEELRTKYKQIKYVFPVLKVQHRYHPGTSSGNEPSYTENVVLGRNFVLPAK